MGLPAITHRHLLLCEGMHDVQFFLHLATQRNLPAFQAVSCGNIVGAPPGRDGIDYLTGALNALPAIPAFSITLEKILIVADNDDDPPATLLKIRNYITAAAEIQAGVRYPVPPKDEVVAGARPSITILMLPASGQKGALDSLLLTAASNKEGWIASCVNHFATCVNVGGVERTKKG